jgi:predicted dienelactone hydrolase
MRILFLLFILVGSIYATDTDYEKVIGVKTLHYTDMSRNRPLTIEFWYPTNEESEIDRQFWHEISEYPEEIRNATIATGKAPYPLILFSHGLYGDRRDRSWLAEYLVHAGFVVASVDHYRNTWDNQDPFSVLQPWDRPLDISAAIDELLDDPSISPYIDADRIGFSGFSLGGFTGLWLAGGLIRDQYNKTDVINQAPKEIREELIDLIDLYELCKSYRDPRIKSYLLLAPLAWEFSSESLNNVRIPIQIIGILNDQRVEFEANSFFLYQNIPNSELNLFKGHEGHHVFLNRLTEYGTTLFPAVLHEDHPSVDRKEIHEKTGQDAIDFFTKTLKSSI